MVNRNLTCACCASTLGLNEGHDYLHDAGGVICKDCIFRESDEACACCGGSSRSCRSTTPRPTSAAGDAACPLSDLLADGNCCASCFREQLARVPGADGLGRHGAVVANAQLDLQLKFAAQDEPLMRNLIRQARSETVRATARQWLLGREKYGASLPVCRDEVTTPPRKSRRL
ncbi:protein-arginine omega-N asymmetric methyltransferase [Aureococcus anophagefferens]|nr:protein-arginine omega-N asymmetric methyltransferase [Aureococcus anophagefferens]